MATGDIFVSSAEIAVWLTVKAVPHNFSYLLNQICHGGCVYRTDYSTDTMSASRRRLSAIDVKPHHTFTA